MYKKNSYFLLYSQAFVLISVYIYTNMENPLSYFDLPKNASVCTVKNWTQVQAFFFNLWTQEQNSFYVLRFIFQHKSSS